MLAVSASQCSKLVDPALSALRVALKPLLCEGVIYEKFASIGRGNETLRCTVSAYGDPGIDGFGTTGCLCLAASCCYCKVAAACMHGTEVLPRLSLEYCVLRRDEGRGAESGEGGRRK